MREIKPSARNVEQVENFKQKLANAQGIYLTDFTGLTVSQITDLRKRFREANVEYVVIKNTLSKVAFKDEGFEGLLEQLDGPNAIAIGYDDPAIPAKIISDFAKGIDKPVIKSCFFDGEILVGKAAQATKDYPTKQEIRSQILGTLEAPLGGLVGVFAGAMRDFLSVLDAYIQKRQDEEK
jgi:large subunit ribosomal protein L10